jgi:hypothetical protein
MKRPTIKVHHPDDPSRPMIVAAENYDPERHRRWQEGPALRVAQTSESPEWWKVLDADDNQHGAAKRTREEAEALLEDLSDAAS